VIIPKCTTKISGLTSFGIWIFCFYVLLNLYSLIFVIVPQLIRTRDFFTHLLDIPEVEMQTVTWQTVVAKIMAMRDANPSLVEKISSANRRFIGKSSKERLDAHDIANRLMRRENYLIAMFNKEILDLTLPLPFLGGRQLFSRHLLWMLEVTIIDYVFFQSSQVSQLFLKVSKRRELSDGLKRRLKFWALLNAFATPLVVPYYMVLFFFRYFNVSSSTISYIYCLLTI
jgi:autophagy-related protein 9